MEKIDFLSLEKAIKSLDEIVERYDREYTDIAIRDALIQRFEYTYSLVLKYISRVLKLNLPELEDNLTFNETIREANKFGFLLSDLEKWTVYRQKRNMSSYTYDESVALSVVEVIKDFRDEVHFVLEQLKKNDD